LDLNDAYAVKTPQDSRKLYAAWAETYDETFIKANDYIYPRTIATYFHERLATEQIISIADITPCDHMNCVGKYWNQWDIRTPDRGWWRGGRGGPQLPSLLMPAARMSLP
jgi:hypothetical protein